MRKKPKQLKAGRRIQMNKANKAPVSGSESAGPTLRPPGGESGAVSEPQPEIHVPIGDGEVMNRHDVDRVLRSCHPMLKDAKVFYSDDLYRLPSLNEIGSIVKQSRLNDQPFRAELFDCDDFSMALKIEVHVNALRNSPLKVSVCFGIAWARFNFNQDDPHAVNWFIDPSRKLWFVEPQTDQLFESTSLVGNVGLILL